MFDIVRENGSISTDMHNFFAQWYTGFSECFADLGDKIDLAIDDDFLENVINLKIFF